MGDWYEIGVTLGLGVAAGVALAGAVAGMRAGMLVSAVGAAAVGLAAGLLVKGWIGAPGGIAGGLIGAGAATVIVRGAVRRGATAGGTAVLLLGAGVAIAALSLVPLLGYVLAVAVPALAFARSRREPERYAGLRTLSK